MSEIVRHVMSLRYLFYAVFVSFFLAVAGFLTTPSMFHFINFEYQRSVPALQEKLTELNAQIADLKKEARSLIAEGNKVGLDLRLRSDTSYSGKSNAATATARALSGMDEADLPRAQSKEELNTQKRISEIKSQFSNTQSEMENRYEDIEEINRSIEKHSVESNNAYLVTRALALGALGALITGLGRGSFLSGSDQNNVHYSTRNLTTSLLIGAVISVVAIGLFYTKQITIFKSQDSGQALPDYWRTTILCLTAGAFADRLFKAASDRVNHYVGSRPDATADQSERKSSSSNG